MRPADIAKDLRALGPMFPVRAGYEAAKRSGLHGALLRASTRSNGIRALVPLREFVPSAGVPSIPPATAQRCLADAEQIRAVGHRAFGRRVPVEATKDWHVIADNGEHWSVDLPWWRIDIRTDRRLGDVKWTWELGRHRDVVVLARAAWLEPDGPWADLLVDRLRTWFAGTELEHSVHWYSNLEIALRCIAWAQVHALVGNVLPPDVIVTMTRHVNHARRHLLVDFAYTYSSMRNNHLLGDALGLMVIQRMLGVARSSAVDRVARRSFESQLARHMLPDGSMVEDSLSYHRFVMEMLSVHRIVMGPNAQVDAALAGAADHLVRLGVFNGDLPQWGDWDEGRVLADSGDPLTTAGSTALALALTRRSASPAWRDRYDEVAWYAADVSTETAVGPATYTGVDGRSGQLTSVRHGDWTVWLKSGHTPSHGHADFGHLSARVGSNWVCLDPGTGTYNGDLQTRNLFKTSLSHNAFRQDDRQILEPHRAFRWASTATVTTGDLWSDGQRSVVWVMHDGFRRLENGAAVMRAVVVDADGFTAVDMRDIPCAGRLTLALHPSTTVDLLEDGAWLNLSDGPRVRLTTPSKPDLIFDASPVGGVHSATYGSVQPAPWLTWQVDESRVSWWSVRTEGSPPTEVIQAVDSTVVGDLVLVPTFGGTGDLTVHASPARPDQEL